MEMHNSDNFNSNGPNSGATETMLDIRHISQAALGQLGVSEMAYIKPVVMKGTSAYAIHAADGTPMALAPSRDLAIAAVVQNDMAPVSVH